MNHRQRQHAQRARADEHVLRSAADRVRDMGASGQIAGLDSATADRLATVLQLFAEHLAALDPEVRRHTCRVAAELVGTGMDRPAVRRTRRR